VAGGPSGFSPISCFGEAAAGATEETGAHFGTAVAAGDLDGDGRADIVAGAPGSALGGVAGAGALFLFASTASGPQYRQRIVESDLGGTAGANDQLGQHLVVADLDGDGIADVAASAPGALVSGVHGGSVVFLPGLTAASRLKSGPIVGDPGPDHMRVWARTDRAASLAVEYKPSAAAWPGTVSAAVATDTSSDFSGAIALTGLQPSSSYDYRLRLDGQPTADTWSFRTPGALGPGTLTTFALGADLAWGLDPFDIFRHIGDRNPDAMFYLGDQIYADQPVLIGSSSAAYFRKYRENWGEMWLKPFLSRVPALMTWDDHEILDNWDQGTADPYAAGRAAYDAYQGSHNPDPRTAGGIPFSTRLGDAAFFFLDTRTFRSPESAVDDASKTMLGQTQKADLKNWLLLSTARFKFIVSSIMWNDHGTTGNDSWAGYTTEREEIFEHIQSHHLCGVVLLSGDQHWTGVFRLSDVAPHYLYEMSPTPLGQSRRTKTTDTGSDILFTYDANKVYGLVTADSRTEPATVSWEVHDAFDDVIYQQAIPWSGLCPDSDGDTVLDDVDCAPDDPTAWSKPGEVQLLWSSPAALGWSAPQDKGGTLQPVYDLLVSPSAANWSSSASCLLTGSSALSYAENVTPSPGHGQYYLVRSRNVCGGILGTTSAGAEIPGRSCP
jgi:alkaline phosphatase D